MSSHCYYLCCIGDSGWIVFSSIHRGPVKAWCDVNVDFEVRLLNDTELKASMIVSSQEPSLYTVKAVLILDNDGDRLYAKVRLGQIYNQQTVLGQLL